MHSRNHEKYSISRKGLNKRSLRNIYKQTVQDAIATSQKAKEVNKWELVQNHISPNHLTTFNYKSMLRLLPSVTKFRLFALDALKIKCCCCHKGRDSAEHVLISCQKIKPIWLYIQKLIFKTKAIPLHMIENLVPTNYNLPNSTHDQQIQAIVSF